jgi:hypothetical protein
MKFAPPVEVEAVLTAFASLFTRPTWVRVQALVCGALLCSNATITAALRALDLSAEVHFTNFHRVLNRARWSAWKAAPILLDLLVKAFTRSGEPLILGLDDTVERRWGPKITARAIYYDAARSTKSCKQKTSGLRWMSLHLLVPIRFAHRVWALPLLTTLAPSQRYQPFAEKGRQHKSLPKRARGLIGAIWRWLAVAKRPLIVVADSTYSTLELLGWCQAVAARCSARSLTLITRLRLDAALYEPAPAPAAGQKGRPRLKGKRLPSLKGRLQDPALSWRKVTLPWYGAPSGSRRVVEMASDTCVWYHPGDRVVPIRWVLIRDPEGIFKTQALLSTNLALSARRMVEVFVRRWQMEVTFEETNAQLGLPGQRQWSDLAIERSTPVRLALFSLVSLVAQKQRDHGHAIFARSAAWYTKIHPTFSDALASVRRLIWAQIDFLMSRSDSETEKIPAKLFTHLAELLSYAA